jgi:hypothetical protein
MGKNERRLYREVIVKRYRKATKAQKAAILDEFCAVCGYHRKYAIRVLNHRPGAKSTPKRPGRKPKYDRPAFVEALKRIWFAADQMGSKRLKAALPLWLPHYERHHGPLDAMTRNQLTTLSAATLDRVLKPIRARSGKKGLCGTKPGTLLRNQIPIRTDHWDITQPGFMEADTVAHCGNRLAGDFVWSLTLTDIHSAWTECRATWNKGAHGVLEQIRAIEAHLPFPLAGFDCDNGSEFLNHHLLRHFAERPQPVAFTRSRPYKKNDNAHVEQKNWSHVRQLLGYDRFDDPVLVSLLNDLYANAWSPYQNHFCPNQKLIDKKRINSKYRKRYDKPQTPYHRLLASPHITKQQKARLTATHKTLDPFTLKTSIEQKLKIIFQYVKVSSNVRRRI